MKKFVVCLVALFSSYSYAQTSMGLCEYGNETVANITCYGKAVLNGTTVTGSLTVMGPLLIKGGTVNELNVKGPLTTIGSHVLGDTVVYGPIKAIDSNYQGNVTDYTDFMSVENSQFAQTVVINSDSDNHDAKLKVGDHSTLSKGVRFAKNKGVVEADQNSQILGEISNGQVIRH